MNNSGFDPVPTPESAETLPPPTIEEQRQLFFPIKPFRFFPIDYGLALGIGAAVFLLLYIFVASISGTSSNLVFFENIFPGFHLSSASGFLSVLTQSLIGLIWSFASGFVLGFLFGFVYNWRMNTK
ncbi:MAG: hypothetical protein ACE5HS_13570 [bacterium]